MIIIGIDPGTATTGYGIIESKRGKGSQFKVLDFGFIQTKPGFAAGERLKIIHQELSALIKKHKPEVLAVESLFFFRNLKTALPVSQAKGVILFTAAKNKIPVHEFTPLQVKFTICGNGRAEKADMQKKIKIMLKLKEIPRPDDAADALGIAICGALKINGTKK